MENYILAIDSGTTSNRAILFDKKGNVAGQAQKEFRQIFPGPALVEHDPDEIWEGQLEVIREVVGHSNIRGVLAQKPLGCNLDQAQQIVGLCQDS